MENIKNIIIKIFNNNLIMFGLIVCLGMIICVSVGYQDTRWDFTNYHYYNAFAFLNNRLNYDIVPSSINTFFNPLLDLPLYFYIEKFNNHPNIVVALQGIWYGCLLFAFYKITTLFFDNKTLEGNFKSILALAIASTGQAVFFQSSASANEISIAFSSFISLYFIFKMIKYPNEQKSYKYFLCGLLLGCALGLKSTLIYICISTGLSLILCFKYLSKPIKFILLLALGGFVGYLITNGWWMYKMWNLYQNPFFPFLNEVFKSPYFDNINYSDRRFIPPISKAIIFPYIWTSKKYRSAEIVFSDFRGPVFYTLSLLFFIYMTIKPKRWKDLFTDKKLYFFFTIFVFLSYVLWLSIFSIYRYIIVVEMLSALFFVKIIFSYKTNKTLNFILYYSIMSVICGVLIFNFKHGLGWPKYNLDKGFVYMETVKMPENSLLKLYNFPTSGVIPILAKYNSFRALGYNHHNLKHMEGSDFVERGKFREIRDNIEKEHKGREIIIYRILPQHNSRYVILLNYIEKEIEGKYCRKLENNLDNKLYICVPEELKDEILPDGDNTKSINHIEEYKISQEISKKIYKSKIK